MLSSLNLAFANGLTASAVRVQEREELAVALSEIGLRKSRPVLVVVGGTSNLNSTDYGYLEKLFTEQLAPLAEELGMTVIDSGTDAGVMRLMGSARAAIGATFPLVGVASEGKIQLPGTISISATQHLEPHHTHFVLVPGSKWGDESPWIAEVASVLSAKASSITILVNGGAVALKDVQESIDKKRLVVVIGGTGRLANKIAAAIRNPEGVSKEALFAFRDRVDFFRVYDLSEQGELKKFLKQHFYLRKSI